MGPRANYKCGGLIHITDIAILVILGFRLYVVNFVEMWNLKGSLRNFF